MVPLRSLGESLALITGGSSGIGLATAKVLSSKGCRIILIARDKEKLQESSSGIDGLIATYNIDVSKWDDVKKTADDIIEKHGSPNILINSAGIVHPGILTDLTQDQIDSIIDIDLKGTINICKAFYDHLIKPGHVVNVSSMAGVIGVYGYTAYSAAKFGVLGFSEALRMELNPRGIGVSVVFPPDTETPQLEFENRTKPEELKGISGTIKPISAEKVASSILGAIVSDEFMIFPDVSSRAAYHANRLVGPIVRKFLDGKVKRTSRGDDDGK
jgi:3-dehydrosphinganine reductase